MFQPAKISYPEDRLRAEFFGDHPWELARPRVILEDGGADSKPWDWSHIQQPGKKLDGESVVQRQMWLMQHEKLSRAQAYDKARREFYFFRHREDVERRVAKEEALAVGAYFGKGPNEIGMELEDQEFERWKKWAYNKIEEQKQAAGAAYAGSDVGDVELTDGEEDAVLDELSGNVPGSKNGVTALAGAATIPGNASEQPINLSNRMQEPVPVPVRS